MNGDGFVRFKRRAIAASVPLAVYVELTYDCGWGCVFCAARHRSSREPALRVEEWLAVFDGLRSLGTLTITFTGGDPLEHPEFYPLAQAARDRAFAVRVFTNGPRIDEAAADRLAALRLLGVEMSLHGATAPVHDAATRRTGSFDQLWRAVSALTERLVPVVLKTLLTSANAAELDDVIALAAARNVPLRIDPFVAPRDNGDRRPLAYTAPQEAIERLMRHLSSEGRVPSVAERPFGEPNCGVGRSTLVVDPWGNVFPCMLWRTDTLGNVRQLPIDQLWRSCALRREVSEVAVRANERLRQIDGPLSRHHFCPALARQLTGDPLQPYPAFVDGARAAEAARTKPIVTEE